MKKIIAIAGYIVMAATFVLIAGLAIGAGDYHVAAVNGVAAMLLLMLCHERYAGWDAISGRAWALASERVEQGDVLYIEEYFSSEDERWHIRFAKEGEDFRPVIGRALNAASKGEWVEVQIGCQVWAQRRHEGKGGNNV